MLKNLDVSLLLDFYGDMLTPKQKEVIELYYNADLSLAEIAAHSGITRQGVRDSIKRAEFQLHEYEEKLGLYGRFLEIQKGLEEIKTLADDLVAYHNQLRLSRESTAVARRIGEIADKLIEIEDSIGAENDTDEDYEYNPE